MTRCRVSVLVLLVVLCATLALVATSGGPQDLKLSQTDALQLSSGSLGAGTSAVNVTITKPISGAILNTSSVTVEWYANENGAAVSSYEVKLDSGAYIPIATATSHNFTDLAQGLHVVAVKVIDSISNTNATSTSFFIDTASPIVAITSPAFDSYLNTSTVTIEWEGSDEPGMGISYFDIRLDGGPAVPVGQATSWTNYSLTETMHTAIVTAHDGSGKTSSASITFYVDTGNPTVSILSPEAGHAFNQSSGSISWEGSDIWSGLLHYEVWLNGNLFYNASIDSPFCTFGELKDGTYTTVVKAIDKAHNVAEATTSFVIDTVDPTLTISSPASGTYIGQGSVMMEWIGNGTGSSISYLYSLDSGSFTNLAEDTSFELTSLPSGPHTVSIEALDAAGNQVIKQVSFIVDLGAPSLIINAPLDGGLINSSSVAVSWTANDDSELDHYEVKVDGSSWANVGLVTNYLVTMLSNGAHLVQVEAFDKAGNVNLTAVHFNVDLEPPSVANCEPNGSEVPVGENIVLTFSEGMNLSSLGLKINGESQTFTLVGNTLTCDPSSDFQFDTQYSVTIEGKDLAGNPLHYEWSFKTTDMGTITGRILNNVGSPIVGANVTLDSGEWNITDENGYYVINAHAGSHNVSVTYPGLGTEKMQVVVEAGGIKQIRDIQIMPEGLSLGWVVAVAALIFVGFLVYYNYQKRGQKPNLRPVNILGRKHLTKQPTFLSKKKAAPQWKKQRKPPEDEF